VAAGLGDLAELVVQALDAVGGIQQLADGRAERQERREGVPGVFPDPDGLGVLLAQRAGREAGQRVQRGFLAGGGVDLAEPGGDRGGVAAGDRPQRVADQVDFIWRSR
jgi:hypothetical protein